LPTKTSLPDNYSNLNLHIYSPNLSKRLPFSHPSDILTNLTNHLLTTRRLLVCGPPNSGKSTLMSAVAKHYVSCSHLNTNRKVTHFTATRSNGLELCQLLTAINRNAANTAGGLPAVLVIDDIHAVSGVTDILQRCLTSASTATAVIACASKPASHFTALTRACHFRCVSLSKYKRKLNIPNLLDDFFLEFTSNHNLNTNL